jgi:uncharacterized protein (TIGR01777 family)
MAVVIAGGSGFLGQKLADRLSAEGRRVVVLSRRARAAGDAVVWQPDGSAGDLAQHLEGAEAVVNLAGEGIADRRWSESRKAALRSSRILATRTLTRAVEACARPPRVFVSASAVGYYGPHGDEPVTETTPPGSDFFGTLATEWEKEAQAAAGRTRLAIIRTGLVLASDGGVLGKMLLPFKLGVGGALGSGRQYMSWIHEDDWTAMVAWLIRDERAVGPFNVTAPEPVTNREFTRALGRALHRPAVIPVPAFALRLVLGELSSALLTGQRVLPTHAEQLGFRFVYADLDAALASVLA